MRCAAGVRNLMWRVSEEAGILLHQIGEKVARISRGLIHHRLDQIGLAGRAHELARLREKFLGTVRQDGLAIAHKTRPPEQVHVDVPKHRPVVERQRIDAAVSADARARGGREAFWVDAHGFEALIERLDEVPLAIIGNHRLMHGNKIRRVARGQRGGELVVAGPIHHVHADMDVSVLRIELVDERGHDPAFALCRGDFRDTAILRLAGAEQRCNVISTGPAFGSACRERQNAKQQRDRGAAAHHTAARTPAKM